MAVRNDFTAGEVLAAADLNDTFASKVDYALPVNAQTGTTYTFVAADAEKLTTASNGSAVTLTIPPASSVAWPDNTVLRVVNYGAGAVTIDGGSGVTVTNTSSTIAQYGAAVAIRTASDAWTVVPFGGGDIPAATVSSPAATGQYTDGGGQTWDYYTFTSSGTLTVDTAGFADVLVVGAGAGGGGQLGGGGGGGGDVIAYNNLYLPAGSTTITVGAGGSGGVSGAVGAFGNVSAIGELLAVGGGGGATNATGLSGRDGASGGGGGAVATAGGSAFSAATGSNGGSGSGAGYSGGGGGGGSTAAGSNASNPLGGNGGAGTSSSITGSSLVFGSGGGGGTNGSATAATGGTNAGNGGTNAANATSGTANRGGGGGGGGSTSQTSGTGGSGVVIVRVKV